MLTSESGCRRSIDVFGESLEPELARGKTIVDPTRFVADPAGQAVSRIALLTLRLAYVACDYFNADIGLATVRAEHQAFYRRVFLHRPLAEPRPSGPDQAVGLMAVDFPAMREKVFRALSVFAFELLRAADAVRAQRRASPSRRRRLLRRSSGPRSFRSPDRIALRCFLPARRSPVPADRLARPVQVRIGAYRRSFRSSRLPSPSRHIYNSLTIAVAFRRLAGI